MSDDFPIPVKVRMWAFMAASYIGNTEERLSHASAITAFLWEDFIDCDDTPAKEDIN